MRQLLARASWGCSLLFFMAPAGCGSGSVGSVLGEDEGDGDGDDDGTPPSPGVTFQETSGGMDLPAFEAQQGTVTVVGTSDAVPVSNRSFTGFRDPERDGDELVRCNYFPNGSAEYPLPYAEVLGGIQGRTHYQAQAQIFSPSTGQSVAHELAPGDSTEDGSQDLIVFAALTHDIEEGAYRYAYAVDEFAHPPYGSSCVVELTNLEEGRLAGSISCSNLIALPTSPDAPVTPATYPTAQVTMQFDCPVMERDPGGGTTSPDANGSCTGQPNLCFILDYYECAETAGCEPSGSCSGTARSCDDYSEFYSCESQSGCYWSGYDCYGFSDSCYSKDGDELGCYSQSGCDWRDDCDGEAVRCPAFTTQGTCVAQGCTWEQSSK